MVYPQPLLREFLDAGAALLALLSGSRASTTGGILVGEWRGMWVAVTVCTHLTLRSLLENLGAAVAMMSGTSLVQGVVRFLQVSPEKCLIEGTIDGLKPGLHGLHVHEFGDVTNSCDR